jgi:hypothetical protein
VLEDRATMAMETLEQIEEEHEGGLALIDLHGS